MDIEPFGIAIPDGQLADLAVRLALTRLPPSIAGQQPNAGIDPACLARLLKHWSHDFGRRKH